MPRGSIPCSLLRGIGFAEARFYDAANCTWLAMDSIKDGGNWYQYCNSNPTTYYDPTGLAGFSVFGGCVDMNKLAEQMHSGIRNLKGKVSGFVDNIDWDHVGAGALKGVSATLVLAIGVATVVATGGAALIAVFGLLGGTVTVGTALVTVFKKQNIKMIMMQQTKLVSIEKSLAIIFMR